MIRCGAVLRPRSDAERETVAAWAAERGRATASRRSMADDGVLEVPGEAVTDPVAYTEALAAAAVAGGSEVRLGARVDGDRDPCRRA